LRDDTTRSGADAGWGWSRRRDSQERTFLVLLFLGALVVRLWGLSHWHGWDENVYLQNALLICCGKNNYNEIDSRPPLLSLLFAGAFRLWRSDYAAWIVTASLNALGPILLYLAGRKLVSRAAAAIAALLLAFTPFFVSVFPPPSSGFISDPTGHSLYSDCPALTLILLALWLLLRALEKESALRFAAAGFVLALAVLMRFPSLASVGVLSLLLLCARRPLRAIAACAAGFLAGIAPYLCWSRIRYGGFLATFFSGWLNFDGEPESFFYYLKWSGVIFSWIALAGLLLWVARSLWEKLNPTPDADQLVSPETSLRLRLLGKEGFLLLWALVLMTVFSSLSHKEPRYVIPVAPPLFLLAGVGLSTLLMRRSKAARTAGTVALAVILCIGFWPDHQRFSGGFIYHKVSEEMRVSEYMNHNLPPATILYSNLEYPTFAYYTNFKVQDLPEDSGDLFWSLNHLPADGVLIAYTHYPGYYPPLPTPAWLDANPHFRRLQEFPSMILYQYRAKPWR
jgi:4-amino-4-deoxy-L-arabinose transferase-like glycosyltransferase